MSHVSLLLDTREHELIKLIPTATIQQLPVGDAWILQDASGSVILERKTVADLEASLLDGRYREQRTRLLAACVEKGARPLYIIEGELDRLNGRMSAAALQKILHRLMLRYGIPVIHTYTLQETADRICALYNQVLEDPKVFVAESLSYTDVQSITKKANREDSSAFASAVLQQCPGISRAIANVILEGCGGTLEGVFQASDTQIAELRHGTRRVGPAVAKRLVGLLHAARPNASK